MTVSSRFASEPPGTRSSNFIHYSSGFIAFVVAIGLGLTLLNAEPSLVDVLRIAALGGLYVILSVFLGDRLEAAHGGPLPWIYFPVQLGVLFAIAWVLVQVPAFGVAWLLFMPLVSQSRILLPTLGTAAVCLASIGIMTWHIQAMVGWNEVPTSIVGIATAVLFVLLFTDIAMRESAARAQSQRLSEELEQANRRLGEYAVQAEELAAARERTRMAQDVQDSVGHTLSAVHMQLEAARTLFDQDPERARDALAKAQDCTKDGLNEIRRSISALRADPLDDRGLHGALVDLADLSAASGLPARFRVTGKQHPLDQGTGLVVYRAAQEALTNARKHAKAKRIDLTLDYGEIGDPLRFEIQDDGVGSEVPEGGFGLLGLQERLNQVGGSLEIHTRPGEGFRLLLEIP